MRLLRGLRFSRRISRPALRMLLYEMLRVFRSVRSPRWEEMIEIPLVFRELLTRTKPFKFISLLSKVAKSSRFLSLSPRSIRTISTISSARS